MNGLRQISAAILAVAALCILYAPATGQGMRASTVATTRYVEIRPLTRDTAPRALVTELPDGTFEFDGHPVFCAAGADCVFYRSLEGQHALAFAQDLDLTAWGLGLPGVSVTASVRARAALNGDFVWPRSEDAFDAMLAYAEYGRDPYRVRLGRQRTLGGLGFAGFDGLSFLIEPRRWLGLELYGGRSLARALYEPRNDALRGVEDFVPDRDAFLIGGWAETEPIEGTALAVRYQREIWSDRSALLSERASLDLRSDQLAPVAVTAGADYDFAFGHIGKAHITARLPVSSVMLEATGRRYLPYFELWTIWGFFSPTAYHEAELLASWRARPDLFVSASAGWRRYQDAQAPIIFSRLKDDSRRFGLSARFDARPGLTVMGAYEVEHGFGAFLSTGDISLQWQPHARVSATVAGSAFQQIEQFRVGEGVVLGGSASVDVEVTPRISLGAGASIYRQTYDNRPSIADWNQRRAWTALRLVLGSDPGLNMGTQP